MEDQLFSAISACEARIENGAKIEDSFKWLREETEQILKGEILYD